MGTSFCDCAEDGYCPRFNRVMSGRFREICAGVDCDLGTAAAFREQWSREAHPANPITRKPPIPLLLKTDQAPGDTVAMTAAVYSLHRAHPGKYITAVESPHPEVWQHNPDVVDVATRSDWLPLQMHYPAIHQSNERAIHFMQGWCEFLGMALGVQVPLLTNRPHLYFADPVPPVGDYWVICSGGKKDFTNKLWGFWKYDEVVSKLLGIVNFVQVGKPVFGSDVHPRHLFADDMVGKTTLRDLLNLVRRARGVVCGVSLIMHVAAALGKPAIVIAGGREPVAWNAYPRQQYLHTIGMLPCSNPQGDVGGACWRSRVVPLGDIEVLDVHTCERPVNGTPTKLDKVVTPECMTMISPARVAELVLAYDRQYEVQT